MSGCRLENFLKNPIVLANHSYGEDEKPTVIGKAVDVYVEGKELIFKIKFAETANAQDWYYLYANGFMNASSIGFNSIKSHPNDRGGYDYLEWELLEISLVSVPCNQNALQVSGKGITKSMLAILNGGLNGGGTQVEKETIETEEEVKEVETEEVEEEETETEETEEEEVAEESEEVEEEETETEKEEEKVCAEPEKVEKKLEDNRANRKIKFADGGVKMNKYEQFRDYCVTAKSLTGSNGGNAVLPEGFVADVADAIAKDPVALRNLVHIYPTTLRTGKIPVTATEIGMDWAESDAAFGEKDFSFGEISYAISDVLAYTKISNDLIADTPVNLYNELLKQVTNVLVKMENAAILAGNGSNKPEGIIANSSVEQITLEGKMTADDIVGLPYEIDVTWRANGVFVVPSELMKEIRLMKNAHGDYLFVQGSLAAGTPSTLAGYPVIELTNVGSKQIVFGDMAQYYLIDRQSLVIDMDHSAAFTENKTVVRFGERVDGKVAVPAAFVVLNQQA